MKTNMGKVFTTLLCMMMCLSLYAQEFTLGMVVGLWNFSAPDAPYGYQKGTCQIKKTGENLSAVFNDNIGQPATPSQQATKRKKSYNDQTSFHPRLLSLKNRR